MTSEHSDTVMNIMRVFYASDAVYTNGSEEILRNDIKECVTDTCDKSGIRTMFALAGK